MMSSSDFCTVDNLSQRLGFSPDSPISIASSRASSVSSCDNFSDRGTEELEVNHDMDAESSDTTLSHSSSHIVEDRTAFPSTDNEDRIQALMAKYEQVMRGQAAQTHCIGPDVFVTRGDDEDAVTLPDVHDRNDRRVDKPKKADTLHEDSTSRRTRCGKKQRSGGPSRVQKKNATVSSSKAYTFLRLGGARRAARGAIECEVHWAPTWLPVAYLEGNDALQEARDVVVDLFGSETWHKEARKLGLLL